MQLVEIKDDIPLITMKFMLKPLDFGLKTKI